MAKTKVKLNNPGFSPDRIESELKSYCRDLGTSGWDAYYGYGISDMTKTPVITPTPTPAAKPTPTPLPIPGDGTDRGYTYRVTASQTAIITDYTGAGGALNIPIELGGYPVSGIGDGAFKGNTKVTSVRIQGIVWIGVSAFEGCANLSGVYF